MNKVINGRRYDTERAKEVAYADNGLNRRDFSWWQETLYQKRTGEFFLHGEGGAMSRYASSNGNMWGDGEKLIPLSYGEAKEWGEKYLTADEYEAIFGNIADDTSKVTVSYSLPSATVEKIKRIAIERNISYSDVISESIANL